MIFVIGFFTAYWAMMVTVAAEQFGTNLRATVATSVPNFVRGSTVPIIMMFEFLRPDTELSVPPRSSACRRGLRDPRVLLFARNVQPRPRLCRRRRETSKAQQLEPCTTLAAGSAARLAALLLWAVIWVSFIAALGYAASNGGLGFLENAVTVTAEPNRDTVKLQGAGTRGHPSQSQPAQQHPNQATLTAPTACKVFRWQIFARAGDLVQSVVPKDTCPQSPVTAYLPVRRSMRRVLCDRARSTALPAPATTTSCHYQYWGYEGEFQFKAE